MSAQDPASLLAAASCFDCFGSGQGMKELMKLALLKQILLAINPNAVTDPQTLLSQANCYSCFGSPGQWQLMELALLAQIAANGSTGGGGGGGGSVQLIEYTSGAPAAPANPLAAAIAYDPTGNLPTLGWDSTTTGTRPTSQSWQ